MRGNEPPLTWQQQREDLEERRRRAVAKGKIKEGEPLPIGMVRAAVASWLERSHGVAVINEAGDTKTFDMTWLLGKPN